MKIISGTANLELSKSIASYLNIPLMDVSIKRFADSEVFVEINENVRGQDVFVIQPTSFPANENIMEMLIILDTLKRASAKRITAVIPYFGYARQDRKPGPRTPISAKLVANILTTAGTNRVLTLDLHAGQIQGFFDIPLDNLYAEPVLVKDIKEKYDLKNTAIISPDVGGVVRARAFAKRLSSSLAIIDKRRLKPNESEVLNIIGDVEGKDCIIVDDIVDTAGTLCNASDVLMSKGAKSVVAYITHGVLSGSALEKIEKSSLKKLVITNSINQQNLALEKQAKISVVSIASLMGEAMKRIADDGSVSSLFD